MNVFIAGNLCTDFNVTQHVPIYAAHLFDAVMLYANALSQTIKSANLTNPSDILEAAKNGRSLFQQIIEQRKYTSKSVHSTICTELFSGLGENQVILILSCYAFDI